MATVAAAREAMASRFEILLHGLAERALRAAAEEALGEIERLEGQLSLFRETSDVCNINARAARKPVQLEPRLFSLLEQAQALSAATGGAFDITVAPLMRCWQFFHAGATPPTTEELETVRRQVGMHHLHLDPERCTIRMAEPGVSIDLGAIGKGYAIESAAEILEDCGVTNALIHGGTSTAFALGTRPDGNPWRISLPHPREKLAGLRVGHDANAKSRPMAEVELDREAIAVSAVWGRAIRAEHRIYGHVMDPRTGQPVHRAVMAATVSRSPTEADALSTALLVLGKEGLDLLHRQFPGRRGLVVEVDKTEPEDFQIHTHGILR